MKIPNDATVKWALVNQDGSKSYFSKWEDAIYSFRNSTENVELWFLVIWDNHSTGFHILKKWDGDMYV